jgi:hypothetical protein
MLRLPPSSSATGLAIAAAFCLTAPPLLFAQGRDRIKVTTACTPTPVAFAYACTWSIANARTGAPIEGANVVLSADMPSMPMAHNVPPVAAKAAGAPGRYEATLPLEMHGEWAVRVTVTGPVRDLVVQVLRFDAAGAAPVARGNRGTGPGSGAGSGAGSKSGSGSGSGSASGSHSGSHAGSGSGSASGAGRGANEPKR